METVAETSQLNSCLYGFLLCVCLLFVHIPLPAILIICQTFLFGTLSSTDIIYLLKYHLCRGPTLSPSLLFIQMWTLLFSYLQAWYGGPALCPSLYFVKSMVNSYIMGGGGPTLSVSSPLVFCWNSNFIHFLFMEAGAASYSTSISAFLFSFPTQFLLTLGKWVHICLCPHLCFLLKSQPISYLWRWVLLYLHLSFLLKFQLNSYLQGGMGINLSLFESIFVQIPTQLNSYLWREGGTTLSPSPLFVEIPT